MDLTAGIGVDAGEVLVSTFTGLESTVLSVIGGIVGASNTVVDMLAVVSSVGTGRVADLEAENASTHEVVPLNDLFIAAIVTVRPTVGVDETAEGVTAEIGAMRVELSSKVIILEVDEVLSDETDDLEVVRGPHKLNTLEGISGDETSAVTGLGAPGDFLPFRLTDGGGTARRCPKTKV